MPVNALADGAPNIAAIAANAAARRSLAVVFFMVFSPLGPAAFALELSRFHPGWSVIWVRTRFLG
ncbi:hypothetical protein NBRC116588_24890 [Pyruvatibacter sp. HU-CL02332]